MRPPVSPLQGQALRLALVLGSVSRQLGGLKTPATLRRAPCSPSHQPPRASCTREAAYSTVSLGSETTCPISPSVAQGGRQEVGVQRLGLQQARLGAEGGGQGRHRGVQQGFGGLAHDGKGLGVLVVGQGVQGRLGDHQASGGGPAPGTPPGPGGGRWWKAIMAARLGCLSGFSGLSDGLCLGRAGGGKEGAAGAGLAPGSGLEAAVCPGLCFCCFDLRGGGTERH